MGIDAPESRTRDEIEKEFGLAAKYKLKELLGKEAILRTQINKNGEDMKGKFGRILGDFVTLDGQCVSEIMIKEGYVVRYDGGSKEELIELHNKNRKLLIERGIVEL